MNRIAILTAVYDDYDTIKPTLPQEGVDVDWVFVTDTEDMADAGKEMGWRVVYEPRPGVHPNRAAKRPKFLPWQYTTAPASVWVDASFRIRSSTFAKDAMLYADPIAQFAHPWRDCLYAEAQVSKGLAKYAGEPIDEQADRYLTQGHPWQWGLWATGVIARWHTDPVRELGLAWLDETDALSFQDQISQSYVLRRTGLRPTSLPGDHLTNEWLTYEGSGRH